MRWARGPAVKLGAFAVLLSVAGLHVLAQRRGVDVAEAGGKRRPRIARYGTPEAEGLDPRHVIGKPHPDRARQFVPFMALKGYFDLIERADEMEGAESTVYERTYQDEWPGGEH